MRHERLAKASGFYPGFPEWQAVYMTCLGDVLRQPALARTIERLAVDGPDAYYRGPIGEAIAAAVQHYGGDLTTRRILYPHARRVDPSHYAHRFAT